jgi:hypothetical protein
MRVDDWVNGEREYTSGMRIGAYIVGGMEGPLLLFCNAQTHLAFPFFYLEEQSVH